MQDDMGKYDLRVVKTAKVLTEALFSLLRRHTFRKITVRDICEEAQVSRATFYARFTDKYDFLKNWLINLKPDGLNENNTYAEIEKIHNDNFHRNKAVIKNLISDADSETFEILAESLLTYFMLTDKYDMKKVTMEQVVLSNFFVGGMIFYVWWHVKNNFPPEIIPMNTYLYELIKKFKEWELDVL